MGDVALGEGDLAGAEAWYEESLDAYSHAEYPWGIDNTLAGLAEVALAREDYDGARARLGEALERSKRDGNVPHQLRILVVVGKMMAEMGKMELAVELLGFVAGEEAGTFQTREKARHLLGELGVDARGLDPSPALRKSPQDLDYSVVERALGKMK
jgi:hypothetical protein